MFVNRYLFIFFANDCGLLTLDDCRYLQEDLSHLIYIGHIYGKLK